MEKREQFFHKTINEFIKMNQTYVNQTYVNQHKVNHTYVNNFYCEPICFGSQKYN